MAGVLNSVIRAVIFDLDGTLVSSSLDFAAIREELACPPGSDILRFIDTLNSHDRERAEAIVSRHEMADAESVCLIPGVPELLIELAENNLRTAIVTRNSREATYQKLSQVNISVDHVITRECAPAKPDPGALLQLCNQWQIEPQEAIYVGDYLYDLLAAENAQMHSCLFVSKDLPDYAHRAGFICKDYQTFTKDLALYLAENT